MTDTDLDPYDAEHIREQLIANPRINALDVQVRLVGGALVVTGNVGDDERRRLIGDAVESLAPGIEVRNDVSVIDMREPTGQEVVS